MTGGVTKRRNKFWLHVSSNGEEIRFKTEPDWWDTPSLYVEIEGGIERTFTKIRNMVDGRRVVVTPPGADWVQEQVGDDSTSWTRSAR